MDTLAGHFLPYRSSQLHYRVWGTGSRILFAFHGYGESAASFAYWGAALPAGQVLVAIDLPFHGLTDWKEGLSLEPRELYRMMQEIAARLGGGGPAGAGGGAQAGAGGSPGGGVGTSSGGWGLAGYSMGGRIALQLFQDHPGSFGRLILLAPDGLTVNPWYRLATRTAVGNHLFRWTMRRPGWLFLLLRLSHALRLVNPSVYKFAVHYIDDRPVRQELYIRWTAMRLFRPRPGMIAAQIRERQVRERRIEVSLIYGRYDRIIRWQRGQRFCKRIGGEAACRLLLLDTGHQLLRPQYLETLLPIFTAHSG